MEIKWVVHFSEAGFCRDMSVLVAILFAKTELAAALFTNVEVYNSRLRSTT